MSAKSNKYNDIGRWVSNVVSSCENKEQEEVAIKLIANFSNLLSNDRKIYKYQYEHYMSLFGKYKNDIPEVFYL